MAAHGFPTGPAPQPSGSASPQQTSPYLPPPKNADPPSPQAAPTHPPTFDFTKFKNGIRAGQRTAALRRLLDLRRKAGLSTHVYVFDPDYGRVDHRVYQRRIRRRARQVSHT